MCVGDCGTGTKIRTKSQEENDSDSSRELRMSFHELNPADIFLEASDIRQSEPWSRLTFELARSRMVCTNEHRQSSDYIPLTTNTF